MLSCSALAGCRANERGDAASASSATPAQSAPAVSAAARAAQQLAGTSWRLVEFQSMDDAIGTKKPRDPSLYTMRLNADGTVAMRLDCNRATGTWSSQPGSDPSSGSFTFGPLAATRARCPPPSMDEQIAAQSAFVRSYLLKDGKLFLSLLADGGIYAWEPHSDSPDTAAAKPSAGESSVKAAAPEDGGPRVWEVTGRGAASLREQASLTATILTALTPGDWLDNLGCQQGEGGVWCDVQRFGGGPRGFVPYDQLKGAVSPDGVVSTGPDDSAYRAGQGQFNATGQIPCAMAAGQPTRPCEFGVARAGGGFATVVITKPDGRKRIVYFRMGRAVGVESSEADRAGRFSATREADLNFIRVGTERYEIPDAVVLGG